MSVVSSTEFGIGGSWLAEYTLDSLQAGVVLFDQGCRITQWNHTAARILGRSEEALAGRALHDQVFDPIAVDRTPVNRANNPVATALETGEAVQDSLIGVRHGRGDRIWLSVTALPVYGPDGCARAALTSIRDVTSEIEAHRLAYTAAIEAHAAFDRSVAGQLVFDRDGTLTRWNARLTGMTGWDDPALSGAHVTTVFDVDLSWLWSALETEDGAVEGPMWVHAADGTDVPCYASFSYIGDEHEPAVTAQVVDPSAIATVCSMGRLPDMFEHVRTPLLAMDDDGVVIGVNRATVELVGLGADAVTGRRLSDLLTGLVETDLAAAIHSTSSATPARPVGRATVGPRAVTVDLFISRLDDAAPERNLLVQLDAVPGADPWSPPTAPDARSRRIGTQRTR